MLSEMSFMVVSINRRAFEQLASLLQELDLPTLWWACLTECFAGETHRCPMPALLLNWIVQPLDGEQRLPCC